jgi:hypothetical protein
MISGTSRSERTPSVAGLGTFREQRGAGGLRWDRLAWGLPAILAAVYLIVLLVDYRDVITSINMYGDGVIAPVLAKLFGQAPPGSQVVLGHHPYYEEFLFLRASAGLPFYRGLWEVTPLLWTLGGVVVLAWSARRALGAFAAMLTASALICLGALGRFSFFTFDWHGLTVIHTILIGCALVWLAPRASRISSATLVSAAVVLGLISGLPTASDVLFLFWALIPMTIAAGLMSSRSTGRARWTPIAFSLITAIVALVAGAVLAHVMRANGITSSQFSYSFAGSLSVAIHNLELLFEGFMSLGGGYFFGTTLNLLGLIVFVSGALIVSAVVLGLREVRLWAAEGFAGPANQRAATSTLAYVGFWASSLVIQSAVFVVTGVPKVTAGSSRYVLAGYVAIMALVPLLARRGPRRRIVVTAAVCLFALSAIIQLARRPFAPFGRYPTATVADRVLQFARAHHVAYGYAGYWDAPDLTWLTRFNLRIYPVQRCGREGFCGTPPARITTWYRPRPGASSILIADSALTGVTWLEPKLGRPLAVTRIGTLTVAVYPFDVASRLPASYSGPRRARSRSAQSGSSRSRLAGGERTA